MMKMERELTRALEKVGLEIIEMLSREVGFENPLKEDPTRICSLMLVHEGSYEDKPAISGVEQWEIEESKRKTTGLHGRRQKFKLHINDITCDSSYRKHSVTLLPKPIINEENANNESEVAEEVEEQSHGIGSNSKEEGRLFSSFSFEDYAWRVYHEPLS
ncbi:hypothetical protein GH714_037213 [Hevea brasiliensis]|uniref:Uncharacterized protein n=1 Tax=Hevea brasiliensis TaxID=3981 RepID=A0A6A6L897_HEVBR|nr:hypothetical protein GH714_037213 [Hevea brasiliensis]